MESKELRQAAERAKDGLRETGRSLRRSRALLGCAQWLIRLLLGAVLATGEVFAGAAPFGAAFVAASGPGQEGFGAMLGAVGGYILSLGLEDGLRYAACSILVFSVAFALFDLAIYQRGWFMPAVAGFFNALTGLVTLVPGQWGPARAAAFLCEVALTVAAVYAFRSAFSVWRETEDVPPGFRQRLGLIFLVLAVLVSLGELRLFGWLSLGRICAAGLALWAGWAGGAGAGAAVGLGGGLAMDLTGAATARFFAVSYALAGLCAGLLRGRARFWCCCGFFAAVSLMAAWSAETVLATLGVCEAGVAALVFLLLPRRVLERGVALFAGRERPLGEGWAYRSALQQLKNAAGAFGEVFSSLRAAFDAPGDNGEDPSVIYDRAANKVCSRCTLRERCWQSDYHDTHDLLNHALPALMEAGQAKAEHFPQRFRDRCIRFAPFLSAVNEELAALQLRRRYASRVGQSRRAVCGQYGDMARLLADAAAAMATPLDADPRRTARLERFLAGRELNCQGLVCLDEGGRVQLRLEGPDAASLADETGRVALGALFDLPLSPALSDGQQVLYRQQEPLSATAGVAGRRRDGQSVSGDACGWFKDERGRLYLLLCDGMGCGREARKDSELCLRLLEKFLRAGVDAPSALKTLDQALCLRGEETGGFSTVDLLELELYEGRGCIYKLGSAPSYLRRRGGIKRLAGRSLPAGLAGEAGGPDCCPFRVDPGDCLVLLTDGVLDGDDRWLRDALMDFDGASPAALAESLVAHSADSPDDKTALVLRIGLRPREGCDGDGKEAV